MRMLSYQRLTMHCALQLVGAAMCAFEHLKIRANNRYLEAVRDGAPVKSGPEVLGLLTESHRMTLFNQAAYVGELWYVA